LNHRNRKTEVAETPTDREVVMIQSKWHTLRHEINSNLAFEYLAQGVCPWIGIPSIGIHWNHFMDHLIHPPLSASSGFLDCLNLSINFRVAPTQIQDWQLSDWVPRAILSLESILSVTWDPSTEAIMEESNRNFEKL
jgi:hypothetical protein